MNRPTIFSQQRHTLFKGEGEGEFFSNTSAIAGSSSPLRIERVVLMSNWRACGWSHGMVLKYDPIDQEIIKQGIELDPATTLLLYDPDGIIKGELLAQLDDTGQLHLPKGTACKVYQPDDSADGHWELLNSGIRCGISQYGSIGEEAPQTMCVGPGVDFLDDPACNPVIGEYETLDIYEGEPIYTNGVYYLYKYGGDTIVSSCDPREDPVYHGMGPGCVFWPSYDGYAYHGPGSPNCGTIIVYECAGSGASGGSEPCYMPGWLQTIPGYNSTTPQILGHDEHGCLRWMRDCCNACPETCVDCSSTYTFTLDGDCFTEPTDVTLTKVDCTWGVAVQAVVDGMVSGDLSCTNGRWILTVQFDCFDTCDGCTFQSDPRDSVNGCPPTGEYILHDITTGGCGGGTSITATAVKS
jgi:hypothetical protein